MKIVYIAHPIGGNIEENLEDLVRILRIINLTYEDVAPIASYFAYIHALNDMIWSERERGIANNTALIMSGVFKECWLTGNKISPGMEAEEFLFGTLGIPVLNYINAF